mmetsp:Transcript_31214/g.103320  ORF Transcript_31214/g.103320 Transcript_31214/m.103320 type:complete len:397 (-) Transcript_31214:501-1691(-)
MCVSRVSRCGRHMRGARDLASRIYRAHYSGVATARGQLCERGKGVNSNPAENTVIAKAETSNDQVSRTKSKNPRPGRRGAGGLAPPSPTARTNGNAARVLCPPGPAPPRSLALVREGAAPLREGALVQRHAHRVVLLHRAVKVALHVAVRAERRADVALAPKLGVQLDGLEPAHVVGREEHPADGRLLLVAAEGRAREQDPLEDDPVRVDRQQRATCDWQAGELRRRAQRLAVGQEGEQRARRVHRGRVHRRNHLPARLHEPLELVLGGAAVVFREDWPRGVPAEARLQHERRLAAQHQLRRLRRGGEREGEVEHRQPVLVRVERREDQRRRRLSGLADAALGAVQLDKAARHPQLQPDVRAGGRASLGWLVDRLLLERLPLQRRPVLKVEDAAVL